MNTNKELIKSLEDINVRYTAEIIYEKFKEHFDDNEEEFLFVVDVLKNTKKKAIVAQRMIDFYSNDNSFQMFFNNHNTKPYSEEEKVLKQVTNILSYEVLKETSDKHYDSDVLEVIRQAYIDYKINFLKEIPLDFVNEDKDHKRIIREILNDKKIIDEEELVEYYSDEFIDSKSYERVYDKFEFSALDKSYGSVKYKINPKDVQRMVVYKFEDGRYKTDKIKNADLMKKDFVLSACGYVPKIFKEDVIYGVEIDGDTDSKIIKSYFKNNSEILNIKINNKEYLLINTNIHELLKEKNIEKDEEER